MIDRNAMLIGDATKASRIIEVGPSHAPIVPKRDGWNTTVVDFYTQDELIEKFTGHPVDLTAIEPVDYNWRGGPLSDAIPAERHGTFDQLIASHVGEHVPDLIAFLLSAQTLLTADGVLALALPDKRFCADVLRPVTTTGDILVAHEPGQPTIHSRRTMFNQVAYTVNMDGIPGWGQVPVHKLDFMNPVTDAFALYAAAADPNHPYVDCHAWQFTPASFQLAILELSDAGLIDWKVAECSPAQGSEFVVLLHRGRQIWTSPAAREARRLELLIEMMVETRAQIDFAIRGKLIEIPGMEAGGGPGDLYEVLARLDEQKEQVAFLRRQLESITAANGTQASIMGFLNLIATRQADQQRALDSMTAGDGTQASIMGSLHLIAARQNDHARLLDAISPTITTYLHRISEGQQNQQGQLDSITSGDGTQASIMGSLNLIAIRQQEQHRQLESITAANGTQASILGFLDQIQIRITDLKRQLESITGSDGTQASILGFLNQINARVIEQRRQLDSITAHDGTQASMMGSLAQIIARQEEQLSRADATAATMAQAIADITARMELQQRRLDDVHLVAHWVRRAVRPFHRLRARLLGRPVSY